MQIKSKNVLVNFEDTGNVFDGFSIICLEDMLMAMDHSGYSIGKDNVKMA